MAFEKKSFVFYCDWSTTINKLTDKQAGILIKHLLAYVNDENPEIEDKMVDIAFEPIKQQLKRDLKKWEGIREKRSEAGKKSASKRQQTPTNSTSVESVEQTPTNSTVNDNVNVTVNVNDTVTSNNTPVGVGKRELRSFKDSVLFTEWNEFKATLPENTEEVKDKMVEYFKENKPDFIEPYAYLWNIFASQNGLSEIQKATDQRVRKLKARAQNKDFDFIAILKRIRQSNLLRGRSGDWKVDFDWIIDNDSNYVKILEGKYNQ